MKNPSAKQKTQVRCLGQEDPLEKEMASHSSILGWRIPRTEEPGGLQSMGSQSVGHEWSGLARTHTNLSFSYILSLRLSSICDVRCLGVLFKASSWWVRMVTFSKALILQEALKTESVSHLTAFLLWAWMKSPRHTLHSLILHSYITVWEGSLFSTPSPAFIVCRFFGWWPFWLVWCWYPITDLICIS